MGQMTSILERKTSTAEVIDRLELLKKDISITERDILSKNMAQKRAIFVLRTAYACISVIYIIFMCIFYKYEGLSQDWWYSFGFFFALIIIAIVVYLGVTKYYKWIINKYTLKLNQSKVDTETILEGVKTTETYAVAKNILDEYSSSNTAGHPTTSHCLRVNYDNPVECHV